MGGINNADYPVDTIQSYEIEALAPDDALIELKKLMYNDQAVLLYHNFPRIFRYIL